MKLSLQRETLLKPLQMVIGVVERKQASPILANVLLSTENNNISITGTDLEVELIGQSALDTVGSSGKLTLPGRKLMDICKALPENSVIDIYKDKDQIIICSGKSRFTLSTLPAEDFPNLEQPNFQTSFQLKQTELRNLIQHCHSSMAQQDIRYYLNGMLLEITPEHLRTIATDGHRLAAATVHMKTPSEDRIQVIIPRKAVLELLKLLGNDEEIITIEVGTNHIRVVSKVYKFTSKLIEGRFPDYERVIPKKMNKSVSIERDLLRDALNRVAILCNEKFRGMRFEFRSNALSIFATNPEQDAAQEEIKITYNDEDLDIAFNVTYLLDVLSVLDNDSITLNFSDANSSLLIEEVDDNAHYTYVIMPMRI